MSGLKKNSKLDQYTTILVRRNLFRVLSPSKSYARDERVSYGTGSPVAIETHFPTVVGENAGNSQNGRNNVALIENVIQGFDGVTRFCGFNNQTERPIVIRSPLPQIMAHKAALQLATDGMEALQVGTNKSRGNIISDQLTAGTSNPRDH